MKLKEVLPPTIRSRIKAQEHIVPLMKQRLPYDIVNSNIYQREFGEEFKINDEIYEALEKSYPRQDVIARLQTEFHVFIFPDELDANNILIRLEASGRPQIQKILQFIQQQGWFVSGLEIDDRVFEGDDQNAIVKLANFQYQEAILTIESTHRETPTPALLYHATPLVIWETKIKEYGLSPKSKSILSTHPERVYFTRNVSDAIDMGRELAKQRLNTIQQQKSHSTKFNPVEYYKHWVVLEVDTRKIPATRRRSYFRVHEDPNLEGSHGLFSQNYVPPKAIRPDRQFNAY